MGEADRKGKRLGRPAKIVIWSVLFLVSVYLGSILFLVKNQRVLQYTPGTAYANLEDVDFPAARLVTIAVGQYLSVRGWYAPPRPGMPVIVYYKGNEGSFTDSVERFKQMNADGYGIVAFDYRGFPMSPGAITQEGVLADALAVFDWISTSDAPVIIWGRSLGTGPATYVASLREAAAVVLESPFTAAVDVAAERYPIFPVRMLMKDPYPSREWIGQVTEPVLVAHGTDDRVINVHHGRDLFALAPNGKELWIVEGGTHTSLWADGIWDRAKAFFDQVPALLPTP